MSTIELMESMGLDRMIIAGFECQMGNMQLEHAYITGVFWCERITDEQYLTIGKSIRRENRCRKGI